MSNKPSQSYSILLMRDDNTVSTFRVRTFWFKLLLFLILLLIVLCGLGIYGSLHYKELYDEVAARRDTLQAELNDTRVRLQERTNLAILPGGPADPASSSYTAGNMVQPVMPGSENGAASGGASSIETLAPSATPPQASQPSQPERQDLQALLGQPGVVPAAGPAPSAQAATTEEHPAVKVSNVSISAEAGNRVLVSFDLANLPQKETFTGNCQIFAVTRQGGEMELETVVRNSLSFRIARYKKMTASLKLPAGLNKEDIVSLHFQVRVPDLPLYTKTFPVKI